VRDAICEKWMTYIYVENQQNWLVWRMMAIKRNFNLKEWSLLKYKLNMQRSIDDKLIEHRHKHNVDMDINKYLHEARIDRMFPLLNPDLDEDARVKANQTWYKDSPGFLTTWDSPEQKTEFKLDGKPAEYAVKSPVLLDFLPSAAIFV